MNVGIGDNKLLAKMASDFEKPDKVHTLFLSEVPKKMWPLPVGDLLTVGGATADKLRQAKIMTIGDLAHTDLARVQKIVGMKMGKHIHNFCPIGTEVNRQIEMGHHWCPINFGPLGQN